MPDPSMCNQRARYLYMRAHTLAQGKRGQAQPFSLAECGGGEAQEDPPRGVPQCAGPFRVGSAASALRCCFWRRRGTEIFPSGEEQSCALGCRSNGLLAPEPTFNMHSCVFTFISPSLHLFLRRWARLAAQLTVGLAKMIPPSTLRPRRSPAWPASGQRSSEGAAPSPSAVRPKLPLSSPGRSSCHNPLNCRAPPHSLLSSPDNDDGEVDEEVLTHMGRSLSEMDDFSDPSQDVRPALQPAQTFHPETP